MTEHETKYEALAQAIGIAKLVPLVAIAARGHNPKQMMAYDPHLNLIPLGRWDGRHSAVLELVRNCPKLRKRGWSLCESVCVLKHVAKFHPVPELDTALPVGEEKAKF